VLVTGHVWEHDPGLRKLLFEVNTLGTINGSLAALELMRPRRSGHLINVISLAGLGAPPGEALYAATKHGAMAFTLGTLADLRREGEHEIRVSAVCPDGIWTPMLHDKLDDPDAAPSFSGILLRPETVAAAVAGLLDRPRVVLTIPRWRGGVVRLIDAMPGLATRFLALWMRDAQRRQRRWKRRIEAGQAP
jgi:NAD(P)-dependent dehydrogenase (short-subunit alcohol dehydrogenase family)